MKFIHKLSLAASDWASTGTRASRGRTDVENKQYFICKWLKFKDISTHYTVTCGESPPMRDCTRAPSNAVNHHDQSHVVGRTSICFDFLAGARAVRVRRPSAICSYYCKYYASMATYNDYFLSLKYSLLAIMYDTLRISWLVQPLHSYKRSKRLP